MERLQEITKREFRKTLIPTLFLLVVYVGLRWWCAEYGVVEALLSGGQNVAFVQVFAGIFFLLLRLLVFLFLPGYLLVRLVWFGLELIWDEETSGKD